MYSKNSSYKKSMSIKVFIFYSGVDYVNILGYDVYGAWQPILEHHSPLFSTDPKRLSIDRLVREVLSYGFNSTKILLGLPTYGRTFKLKIENNTVSIEGPGTAPKYTRMPGMISFYETCDMSQGDTNLKTLRDKTSRVPVSVFAKTKDWIGYDDSFSLTEKVNHLLILRVTLIN
jgi:GH18 family chitinase